MRTLAVIAALALFGLLAEPAEAQCTKCGCGDGVCKLVKTTKKITQICWGCKDKTVCIPRCGCKVGEKCEEVDCGKNNGCRCLGHGCSGCTVKWTEYEPGDLWKVRTVKQLVKFKVTKEIPTYKWVVTDAKAASCGCAAKTAAAKKKAKALPVSSRKVRTAAVAKAGVKN